MKSKNSLNGSNHHQPYFEKMPYYNQVNADVNTLKSQ